MNDTLFQDSPLWLDRLFQRLDENITLALEKNSRLYKEYKKRIETLYEENPAFAEVIEGAEEYKPLLLNEAGVEKLSELVRFELDVMEIYQRALYIIGIRNGIEIGKMFADFGEEL